MSRKPEMVGKLDGTRALVYKERDRITIINRRGIILNTRYPELIDVVENIKAGSAVLDSEIIVLDKQNKPNFYMLAEREHISDPLRIEILSKQMPATFIVFDILRFNGKDLSNQPLMKRKKILSKVIKESERINLCFYTEDGEKLFRVIKRKKLEGVMAKQKQSFYYSGERKDYWLKIKYLKSLDCVITGYSTGTGKRGELLGSLIAGCYHQGKLRYVGKIGTGFSEEELKELLERLEKIKTDKCPFKQEPDLKLPPERKPIWVKPKYICEVRFMNLSRDKIMRAPSFMRLRTDKNLKDCILEV